MNKKMLESSTTFFIPLSRGDNAFSKSKDTRSGPQIASQMDDSALNCSGDGFRPVGHAKFAKDVFQVILHGVFDDVQGLGDFFLGQSLGQFVQKLHFTGR